MDSQLEQQVLAILLAYPDSFFQVQEDLSSEDFKDLTNRNIYEAILTLNLQGFGCDVALVKRELDKNDHIGLGNYLIELNDRPGLSGNLKYYVKALKENRLKALVSKQALTLYENISKDKTELETSLSEHVTEISKLMPVAECRADTQLSVKRFLVDLENRKKELASGNQMIGIPTGVPSFDLMTRGLRKYSLTTIAALSGSYKSYFALNIATNYAKQGKSVLYFSLEMSDIEMLHRAIPMVKPPGNLIKSTDFYEAQLNTEKQKHFQEAVDSYGKLNITMDWGTRNFQKIILFCEKVKRSKIGLDLVIIDHIQLLEKSSDPFVLAEYTGALKAFALTNNVPVIMLSQFNKQSGVNVDNPRPRRSWLKGSSSIEHDSDVIMFLHRENKDLPETTLILEKFRQSETAKTLEFNLLFDEHTNVLKEHAKVYLAKPKQEWKENSQKAYRENPYVNF